MAISQLSSLGLPISGNSMLGNNGNTAASWAPVTIAPLSLIEPMVQWHEYFKARGYKDWGEAVEHFSSVAKLTGAKTSELMLADLNAWGNEVK